MERNLILYLMVRTLSQEGFLLCNKGPFPKGLKIGHDYIEVEVEKMFRPLEGKRIV